LALEVGTRTAATVARADRSWSALYDARGDANGWRRERSKPRPYNGKCDDGAERREG
jgi:hypothetical protein